MKNALLFLGAMVFSLALSGQSGSTLFHEDKVSGRGGSTFLNPDWAPFYHGVASGDPLEDRVIIWTRVTPEDMTGEPVPVNWRVATDADLQNVVASGDTTTNADRDYTVKVDVTGLEPGRTYYYGFTALDKNSLTGKTKTTPTGDQATHLKFGVVSCNNFEHGYFNAFQRLAERTDLDAVIHLGDYIYEQQARQYGDSDLWDEERVIEPEEEVLSLEQYRTRYSTYRLDTMMARVHQQHPFITVWDDHESANDAWKDGAQAHDPDTEGPWEDRLAVAKQVYFEWLPIRDYSGQDVFRKISYGNLVDLIMLDTRITGREQQINDINNPDLQSPDRTILGSSQKQWLKDQLSASTAKWKILGQQVIFVPFEFGWAAAFDPSGNSTYDLLESTFLDIWDGYPAERQEIVDFITGNDIDNVVILTGDFHTTFAFDVTTTPNESTVTGPTTVTYDPSPNYDPDTGGGSVAVEFATPSVSSANFDENLGDEALASLVESLINQNIPGVGNPNPHMKYTQLTDHGYYILDVKADSVQANYYFSPIGEVAGSDTETFGEAWYARDGQSYLRPAAGESAPKEVQDTPAPNDPPMITSTQEIAPASGAVLGVYPNPFQDTSTLHYSVAEQAEVQIDLLSAQGQLVRKLVEETLPAGVYTLEMQAGDLPAGTYVFRIAIGNSIQEARVVLKR